MASKSLSLAGVVAFFLALPAHAEVFWQPLHEPGTNGWGTSIEVSPFDSKTLAVGGDMFGSATTNDQGANWSPGLGFEMWEMSDYTWHPTNPDVVWAGSEGGPYQSLDNGKTWTPMRSGMPAMSTSGYAIEIQKIIFDPNDSDTLLALGGAFRLYGQTPAPGWGQIWQSTNGGSSWSQIGSVGDGINIFTGGFAAGSSSVVYVLSPSGVFQSTDGGATWNNVTGSISGTPAFLALHPTDPNTLWVVTQSGLIFKSTDGAQTWQPSSTGLQPNNNWPSNDTFVVVNASNPDMLYAAIASDVYAWEVYLSTDGGATWTDILDNSSSPSKLIGGDAYFSAFGYGNVQPVWLATDPSDPQAVYMFVPGLIFRSLDSGNTWMDISSHQISGTAYRGNGYQGEASTKVKFSPFKPGQLFTVAMDCGKLVRSSDFGWSWIAGAPQGQSNLWNGSQDVTFSADGTIHVATGQNSSTGCGSACTYEPVLKSTDWGATWGYVSAPPNTGAVADGLANMAIYTLPNDSSTVWVGIGWSLYQSVNGGQSWTDLTDNLGTIYNIAADPTTPTTFYVGAGNGVFQTTDGVTFNPLAGEPGSYDSNTVYVDPMNPTILFAVVTNSPGSGVWKIDGANWTQLWSKSYASALAIDPQNDQRLAVITTGWVDQDINCADGVWLSQDGGQTWTQINTGLQLLRGNTIAFNPDGSGQLIVGLGGGGYAVTDLGTSTPVGGSPASVPGTIAAGSYDLGGEGSAYHLPGATAQSTGNRSDDIGICGANGLCNLAAGEWIKYQVNVGAGYYDITVDAAATADGAAVHLEVNGLNVTGPLAVLNQGASAPSGVVAQGVLLAGGVQYLKVYVEGSGVNLEDIVFNQVSGTPPATTSGTGTGTSSSTSGGTTSGRSTSGALSASGSTGTTGTTSGGAASPTPSTSGPETEEGMGCSSGRGSSGQFFSLLAALLVLRGLKRRRV